MPLSDKNILITPNRGAAADPTIVFSGANVAVGPQNITATALPLSNGTVSFSGSAGQLFSITNSLTGTIFSVNDVSGIPSIEVNSSGVVTLAQFSGNVGIGTGTPGQKLTVIGSIALGASTANQSSRIQVADGTSGVGDARFLFRNGTDTQAALRLVVNSTNFVALDSVQANNSAVTRNLILQPNGGAVGITNSAPSETLVVGAGTSDTRATFRPNTAFAIGVANGAGFAGWIGGSGVADNMVFSSSGGSERMRINASGNLGIGTNNPGARLTVSGASILANNTAIDPDDYANQVVAGAIADGSGFGLSAAIGGNAGAGDSWALGHNGGALFLGVGNGTEPNSLTTYIQCESNRNMYLAPSSGGRIAIGNTNPLVSLDMGTRTDAIRIPVGTTAQRPAGAFGYLRANTNTNYIEFWDPTTSSWVGIGQFSATGGTISTYTSGPTTFTVHTFTTSGTFQVTSGSRSVDYLIVAGGGGGGPIGGGGGGGGFITGSTTATVGTYNIVIGGGGNNGNGSGPSATNGSNSSGFGLTAIGGGGGGNHISGPTSTAGLSGGSGGGGADNATPGGAGTAGQGNAGGTGIPGIPGSQRIGGGGGGAGAAGASGSAGGAGGNGLQSGLDGTTRFYAGGGGAGGYQNSTGGNGGLGGGGGGSVDSGTAGTGGGSARNPGGNGVVGPTNRGGNGGANTGGGGGGCSWQNPPIIQQGGSGIVIIRYVS